MRDGRVLKEGEIMPIRDTEGGVLTYGEVRKEGRLWINVSKLEHRVSSRWADFYRLSSTRQLIEAIKGRLESRLGDSQGGSGHSNGGHKTDFLVLDTSRCQYQKADKEIYKGTWVLVDLASAFMEHVDKSFHAKWCGIMGRCYSGDHSAVADVLTETDAAAGTESVGSIQTRSKRHTTDVEQEEHLRSVRPRVMRESELARYERYMMVHDPLLREAQAKVMVVEKQIELVKAESDKIDREIRLLQLQREMRTEEDYLPPEYTKASKRLRNVTQRTCSQQVPGVYVFVSKYGSVPCLKIGLSVKNVNGRVREAATWHTDAQKRLLFALPVPTQNLRDAEKFVHQQLYQENIEREMFGVEFSSLAPVLADMAENFMDPGDTKDLALAVFGC